MLILHSEPTRCLQRKRKERARPKTVRLKVPILYQDILSILLMLMFFPASSTAESSTTEPILIESGGSSDEVDSIELQEVQWLESVRLTRRK